MNTNNSVLAIHMGENFYRLSPLLQKAHIGKSRLSGIVKVQRGNFLARIICTFLKFPKENSQSKLTVICSHSEDQMSWERNFDGLIMKSNFRKQGKYLVEYLGPLAMSFEAKVIDDALHYRFIKTEFFKVLIPKILSPNVIAFEQEINGKYSFSVNVNLPFIGLVISYSGQLMHSEIKP